MSNRVHCPLFHEFDGQCCADGEDCICPSSPRPAALGDINEIVELQIRARYLRAAGVGVAICALLGFFALVNVV